MKRAALLLLLIVPSFGQERNLYTTDGHGNCRTWNQWPYDVKVGYMQGFIDARAWFPKDWGDFFTFRITANELVKSITSTCSKLENVNIDLPSVLIHVFSKLRGIESADSDLWRARLHADMQTK
jgi:hypothetical protein